MERFTTIRCRSWDDFKHTVVPELFGDAAFQRGHFIFRGQRSADWGLVPSFERWLAAFPGADPETVAQQLLDSFQHECANGDYGVSEELLGDRTNLLALGQHYG